MNATKPATLAFCNVCEKVTYVSAVAYHRENPCNAYLAGYDCMEFEDESIFCECEG